MNIIIFLAGILVSTGVNLITNGNGNVLNGSLFLLSGVLFSLYANLYERAVKVAESVQSEKTYFEKFTDEINKRKPLLITYIGAGILSFIVAIIQTILHK